MDKFFREPIFSTPRLFSEENWYPSIDVSEGKRDVIVKAEIPGVMAETKEIQPKEKQELSVPAEQTKPGPVFTPAVEYPGVKIARDEDYVSMDVIFHNEGKSDENVNVWIADKPPGWQARVKTYLPLLDNRCSCRFRG